MTPTDSGRPKPPASSATPAAPATPASAPTPRPGFRIEKDPLGYLEVPDAAYYGVQTARGIHNFPISGTLPHRALVRAIVQVKKAAARANMATGRLPKQLGNAIVDAATRSSSRPNRRPSRTSSSRDGLPIRCERPSRPLGPPSRPS
jgi:hypothetical protein